MSQLVPGTGYIGPITRDEPIKCGHAYVSQLKGITPVVCCKLNGCQCAIVKWKMHQGEYVQLKDVTNCPKYIPPKQVGNKVRLKVPSQYAKGGRK